MDPIEKAKDIVIKSAFAESAEAQKAAIPTIVNLAYSFYTEAHKTGFSEAQALDLTKEYIFRYQLGK